MLVYPPPSPPPPRPEEAAQAIPSTFPDAPDASLAPGDIYRHPVTGPYHVYVSVQGDEIDPSLQQIQILEPSPESDLGHVVNESV